MAEGSIEDITVSAVVGAEVSPIDIEIVAAEPATEPKEYVEPELAPMPGNDHAPATDAFERA